MARQRTIRRGRTRRRPIDWVANDESWNTTSPPYILNPTTDIFGPGGGSQWSWGEMDAATLTFHQDLLDDNTQMGIPQLEQTGVRVVGSLNFGLMAFDSASLPTVNLTLMFDFRIVVGMQNPESVFAGNPGNLDASAYNMMQPYTANDDFLWHYHDETVLSNSFWSEEPLSSSDWRLPQRLPIDVRVSRRLKQREALYLLLQMSSRSVVATSGVQVWNVWADLRGWVQPQLRTLVRTIT